MGNKITSLYLSILSNEKNIIIKDFTLKKYKEIMFYDNKEKISIIDSSFDNIYFNSKEKIRIKELFIKDSQLYTFSFHPNIKIDTIKIENKKNTPIFFGINLKFFLRCNQLTISDNIELNESQIGQLENYKEDFFNIQYLDLSNNKINSDNLNRFLDFLIQYENRLSLGTIILNDNNFKMNSTLFSKINTLSRRIRIIYEQNKEDINHIIQKINIINDKLNKYKFYIDKIKINQILSGEFLFILKTNKSIFSYNIEKYDSMKNTDGYNIYHNFKHDIYIDTHESPIEVSIIQIRNEEDKIIPGIKGNINLKKKEQDKNISILLSYSNNNNIYLYNDKLYDSNDNPIGMISGRVEKLI